MVPQSGGFVVFQNSTQDVMVHLASVNITAGAGCFLYAGFLCQEFYFFH
jgi:hypothetical protein